MHRKEMTFRITKIGKTAVSVAVCGLMMAMSPAAMAVDYDIVNGSSPVPTITGNQNSVNIYSSTNGSPYVGTLAINLAAGVDLSGQVVVGTTPWAVFTSKYLSEDQWVRFDFDNVASSLTLNGGNEITGVVGWYYDPPGTTTNGSSALDVITIYNTGNVFNNAVYANDINLNSGSSVQFLGNVDGTTSTNLNYQGSNSTVTLGTGVTLDGNVTNTSISNSSLVFNGTGTITGSVGSSTTGIGTVQVNGNGALVRVNGNLSTDRLDYQAASTVAVGGNLYLNVNTAVNATNAVTLGNTGGVLEVGGNIVGVAGKAAVTTTLANTGTVTMVAGTQSITGNIGSNGLSIGTLNIGGAYQSGVTLSLDNSDSNASTTTINGDVYAQTIRLNNDDDVTPNSSTLIMASGKNLTGAVVTENNGMGNLTLAGGTQTVTGTVGASGASLDTVTSGAADATSTFTGTVYATNVTNSTGTGASTFQADVTATNVGVNNGTSTFQQSLTATTTTIGTGTGHFNTVGGTTSSNIVFAGAGTANLNQGLTGAIDFDGQAGTVNLADGESISGAVTGDASVPATVAGTLNALGGGTLSSNVGKLTALNVNKYTAGATTDNVLATAGKILQANGSIDAASVKLFNDGTLQMADNTNLAGAVTTTTDGTGTLTLQGTSTVTGNVGVAGTALKTINAGQTGELVTFNNGVAYANTLKYSGDGEVVFNGLNSKTSAVVENGALVSGGSDLGFVGTVDFGTNVESQGELTLGNNVDLVTQHNSPETPNKTTFVNANGATLNFAGSSVVSGQLGSGTVLNGAINTIGSDTFGTINAGVTGSKVTFLNDVYVSGSTFHVTGEGTVNFVGDLNGPLVYDADGFVNVADGQNINGTVSVGTTPVSGTGTLNFVGSATTQADIGTAAKMLKAVNFHASSSDTVALPVTASDATINIGDNVYALTTTIGTNQNDGEDGTIANVTGNVFLGNALTLAGSNVTLNTAGTVTDANAISAVDFVHTKNANGTLTNTATVTQSTTGTGAITTNRATLNFALATTAWDANAGGTANAAGSSSITGGAGSTLAMNGSETVNLSLLGSLRNGQQYTLIDVASDNDNTALPSTVNDNSYVITTTLTRSNNNTDANADLDGDLIVTATRADNVYITASNTTGHFSNPAALRLGTLAAAGASYSADMQTVLNKLDIDQWGFGNNAANLAVQAQRLAPLANNSIGLSAFTAASAVSDSLGMRMHQIRIPEQAQAYEAKGVWLRSLYNQGKQEAVGQYDGFKSKVTGMTFGVDAYPSRDSLVGLALSYSTTDVEQQNFRQGDEASMDAWHLSMYAAYNFTPEWFVDGTLTGSKVNTTGNRSTAVGRVASFDVDGTQWTGKVNLGYRFKLGDSAMFLTPILSLQSSSLKQDAYNETGAGDIGLEVAGVTLRQNQAALGLRLDGTTFMGGMVVKPEITLAATRDSGAYGKDISAQFIGDLTNTAFTTEAAEASGLNGVKLSMGLGVLLNKTTSMALRYEHAQKRHSGVSGKAFSSDAVEFNVRWNF